MVILQSAFARIVIADHGKHLSPLCKQIRNHRHLKNSGDNGKYYPCFLFGIQALRVRIWLWLNTDSCCWRWWWSIKWRSLSIRWRRTWRRSISGVRMVFWRRRNNRRRRRRTRTWIVRSIIHPDANTFCCLQCDRREREERMNSKEPNHKYEARPATLLLPPPPPTTTTTTFMLLNSSSSFMQIRQQ